MAVASETAEGIDPLPMEPSASKSTSDLPSELSSPSSLFSAADTPDLTDHSNSSPNPNRDGDIQPLALLRSEEYRQLFRLPSEEALVQDFNCAFQESILLQGHMYLFTSYICFYSNIFGFETKKIIPFIEITSVKRAKTAGIFPNAIEIFGGGRKYFFASFLSRDEAFKLINDGWLQHCNGAKAIPEHQESISVSDGQDDGLVVIEKVDSFKEVNELDSSARDKDTSPSNDYKLSPPSSVENDSVSVTLTETQDNVERDVERVGYIDSSSSVETWTWNEEETDAPERPFGYGSWGWIASHLVIETSQEINDVPYGDYFRVEGLWDIVKDGDESKEGCILRIYVDVAFSKKTVFKGKIVQSTLDECREAYALWINMAHELLKQKNLERREEGRATSVIQNREVNLESEVKTGEALERSTSQLNDHGRPAHVSGLLDVNERVSILVLLNRPQNVHVAPSGNYYIGSMGGGIGERSAEAVAWLERRMHHLKDEMFMVEAQLERLRHEHNWLKAQLKDLDGLRKRK
ncbi:hypothetical protein GH714_039277 [Hevea brasiliensis]|uniref:VASt domain-containing protein n=1 Tax=Hevea brasiliensis TaxID=3981 RepID=A0A6A6MSA9_HEVBR|nr:hypothetical protein GH714_039277 [Hevea brasiliensis]